MNLFKTYKQHYQRAHNAPSDELKQEIACLAKTFWDTKKSRLELLAIAKEIVPLEKQLLRVHFYYGPETVRSIQAGEYTIDVPYQIQHRYNNIKDGYVYILVSPDRPGHCKLGATTLTMTKRCALYHSKFGYSVEEYSSILIDNPFHLENLVKKKAAPYRVSGLTYGDSNEWYNIEPERLANLVNETSEEI